MIKSLHVQRVTVTVKSLQRLKINMQRHFYKGSVKFLIEIPNIPNMFEVNYVIIYKIFSFDKWLLCYFIQSAVYFVDL